MAAREEVSIVLDPPLGDPMMHRPDAMGVGDGQRPDEIAGILYPMRAGHLAIAVQGELPRPHRLRRATVLPWPHRRDPGPHLLCRISQGAEPDRHPDTSVMAL